MDDMNIGKGDIISGHKRHGFVVLGSGGSRKQIKGVWNTYSHRDNILKELRSRCIALSNRLMKERRSIKYLQKAGSKKAELNILSMTEQLHQLSLIIEQIEKTQVDICSTNKDYEKWLHEKDETKKQKLWGKIMKKTNNGSCVFGPLFSLEEHIL